MQNAEETDPCSEMLSIRGDLRQRFARRLEQQAAEKTDAVAFAREMRPGRRQAL